MAPVISSVFAILRRNQFAPLIGTFACALVVCCSPSFAQQAIPLPRLDSVFPFSAKVGSTVDVTIAGDAIEGSQGLVFDNPGITAAPVMNKPDRFFPDARPADNKFTVTVAATVLPGYYEARVTNKMGVTNARMFIVGEIVETLEKDSNNSVKEANEITVNSAVSGHCREQKYDYFKFQGKQGQRLIIHCDAQRADTRADVNLSLSDAKGSILKRAHDPVRMDPTIDFTPPTDGEYFIAVNDFLFRGGELYAYRLSISTAPWIEYIDPPIAQPGVSGQHTIYGRNLPGGTPAPGIIASDGTVLEKLAVTIPAPADPLKATPAVETFIRPQEGSVDSFAYRLPSPNGLSNPVRMTLISGGSVIPEQAANDSPDKAQALTLPAQVLGRFDTRGDADWYTFTAKKGDKVWIEVTSQRLGLPTDPFILVQQAVLDKEGKPALDKLGKPQVKDVGEADDIERKQEQDDDDTRLRYKGDDPGLLFVAPEDGTYRLMVKDQFGTSQGDARFFYVLAVRPAQADFALAAFSARPDREQQPFTSFATVLRKGGTAQVDFIATRRDGFTGEIRITADPESLPKGVTADPAVIGVESQRGSIVLRAAADAPVATGAVRFIGTANGAGDTKIVRLARPMEVSQKVPEGGQTAPMRMVKQMIVTVCDDMPAPASIDAGEGKVWRTARGGKLEIPVKVTRAATFTGALQLTPAIAAQQIRAQPLAIEAGPMVEKKLPVDVDAEAKVGTFSFVLRGPAPIQYLRSPEYAKQTVADRERIAAVAKKSQEDSQKAATDRQKAEQTLQTSTAASQQAEQLRVTAEQQLKQAKDAETAADVAMKAVQKTAEAADAKAKEAAAALAKLQADEKADAAAKQTATASSTAAQQAATAEQTKLTAAAKALADASAKTKTMAEALTKAETTKTEAEAKAREAATARDASMKAEEQAKKEATEAEQFRAQFEQKSRQIEENAKPRESRLAVHSQPVIIEIVATPFTLTVPPATITLQAGNAEGAEVSASITRDFGFATDVKFDLKLSEGLAGISLSEKGNAIPAGQNGGKLILKAESSVKPGNYTIRLRSRYNFGGRDLAFEHEQPIPLTVTAPAPPPEKK